MGTASPADVAAKRAGPSARAPRAFRTWHPRQLYSYLFVLPMVVLCTAFLLYPAAATIWISFTNWTGINALSFIGLENYSRVVTDPAFRTSFENTLLWVVGTVILQVVLGLTMAVVLNSVFGGGLLKILFYLPAAISGAAVGVIWVFIFDPTQGVINTFLGFAHLSGLERDWLSTPWVNTVAMIVASTWQGMGPNMMLCLVGLQTIPKDPIEAAVIDGASRVQLFWRVTLPLLRPMLTVVVALALINSFKVFDIVWSMTQGGPYRSSETLAVTMYRESFVSFQLGYGASVAVVLTAIVFVMSIFYLRTMFRKDVEVY